MIAYSTLNKKHMSLIIGFTLLLFYIFIFLANQHLVTSYTEQDISIRPISSTQTTTLKDISITNIIYDILFKANLQMRQILFIIIFLTYAILAAIFLRTASMRGNILIAFMIFAFLTNSKYMLYEITSLNFHIEQACILMLIIYFYQKTEKSVATKSTAAYFFLFIYSLMKYNNFLLYASIFSICEIVSLFFTVKAKRKKSKLISVSTPLILLLFLIINFSNIATYVEQKPLVFNYAEQGLHLSFLKNSCDIFLQKISLFLSTPQQLFFSLVILIYGIYAVTTLIKRNDYKIPLLISALVIIPLLTHILTIDCSFDNIEPEKEGTRFADIFPALILIPIMFTEIFTLILSKIKTKYSKSILAVVFFILYLNIISESNFTKMFFDNPAIERKNVTAIIEDLKKISRNDKTKNIVMISTQQSQTNRFLFGFNALGIKHITFHPDNIPQVIKNKIKDPYAVKYVFSSSDTKEKTAIYYIGKSLQ